MLATPWMAGDEAAGELPLPVAEDQLPGGEDLHVVEVVRAALVGDGEPVEAVDLVAPQVDAHRIVGGRREDVDDRAPAGDLAAVLDLELTAVPGGHEAADELVGVDLAAPADHDRRRQGAGGGQTLDERPHRCDDGERGGAGRRVGAAPRAAAPWCRWPG